MRQRLPHVLLIIVFTFFSLECYSQEEEGKPRTDVTYEKDKSLGDNFKKILVNYEDVERGKAAVGEIFLSQVSKVHVVKGDKYPRNIYFDGSWEFNMDIMKGLSYIKGGSINNAKKENTDRLVLQLFFSLNPYKDGANIEGYPVTIANLNPLGEGTFYNHVSFDLSTPTLPPAGVYYPLLVVSEDNIERNEYIIQDIIPFGNTYSLDFKVTDTPIAPVEEKKQTPAETDGTTSDEEEFISVEGS